MANPDKTIVDSLPTGLLTGAELAELWSALTGLDSDEEPDAWEVCEDVILGSLSPQRGLEMRPGGWTIDLANTMVRAVVAAGMIAGAMSYAGMDQLPGYILPAVLPLLFDIERARLDRQERRLLLELRLSTTAESMDWPWYPPALYERLPDKVRSQVSETDFEEFVERLFAAGEVDDAGYGEVRLRPAGRPAWLRLTIRH